MSERPGVGVYFTKCSVGGSVHDKKMDPIGSKVL